MGVTQHCLRRDAETVCVMGVSVLYSNIYGLRHVVSVWAYRPVWSEAQVLSPDGLWPRKSQAQVLNMRGS